MLIYVNDQLLVMIFGVAVAIGAKWVLRAPVRGRLRHYMNPSNFGITVILLLFPWASIAPPYHAIGPDGFTGRERAGRGCRGHPCDPATVRTVAGPDAGRGRPVLLRQRRAAEHRCHRRRAGT
jgi:hypothetical protein